jgi:hypothetical protein
MPPSLASASFLLAGHQPELFHPGVWIKNFALNGLARRHGAVPLNLVVDNDTAKAPLLLVPPPLEELTAGAGARNPLVLPFDLQTPEVPYEERRVQDEALLASLPERAAPLFCRWPFQPLLPSFWQAVLRQTTQTDLLGERFVRARRAVERAWGCHNLEVPLSSICQTQPFAWFACHLVTNLERFHAVHNSCLEEYRRLYGIRSRSHPVPDLASEGDWREAPFWAWRPGQSRRGRLMARTQEGRIELRVGGEAWPALPLPGQGNARQAVAAWQGLEAQGYKIRTRALTTTLYARLFLADLFIHGIGGAKYDEVTDEIIRRFYEAEPPDYLVLTATVRLPLPTLPVTAEKCRRLAWEQRDLYWNPQRHLPEGELSNPRARELVATKEALIARQPHEARGREERYHRLRETTERLRLFMEEKLRRIDAAERICRREVAANAVLSRRDYAFCLYPESSLRPFFARFLTGTTA